LFSGWLHIIHCCLGSDLSTFDKIRLLSLNFFERAKFLSEIYWIEKGPDSIKETFLHWQTFSILNCSEKNPLIFSKYQIYFESLLSNPINPTLVSIS
jgi:hypothetical protein